MTRRNKHASARELASMAGGEPRTRRAARIQAHIAQCEQCTRASQQLNAIRTILANATYPPMPDHLSARIDSAISREARRRQAALPATGAGDRNLPARRPRAGASVGWRMLGLSVSVTRLAAAASAVVIAVAGSYLAAENVGRGVTRSPSSPLAGAVAPTQRMTLGPEVTYGQPGSLDTIRSVESHTNFVAAHLRTQAISALDAAEAREPFAVQLPPSTTALLTDIAADPSADSLSARQLAQCIGLISPGRTVLLIEIARYQGRPAAVIVTATAVGSDAKAWVVGSSCSARRKDVLHQTALGNL